MGSQPYRIDISRARLSCVWPARQNSNEAEAPVAR